MDALVTDVHVTWALAGVRALGQAGLSVLAAGPQWAAGRYSRMATASADAPDSARDPAGFAAAIERLVRERRPSVVYPGQEEAIDALYAHGVGELPLPYPGPEPLALLRDKRSLDDLARGAGLAVPETLARVTAGELPGIDIKPPFVVKSARPGGVLTKTKVLTERTEVEALAEELPDDEAVLVQERAEGPLIGLALVVDRSGAPVARFQQVAHRIWPPEAGGSSLAVSVAPDPGLVERATAVLTGAGYWGFAQIQFLRTARGLALIDVNPRFYGSMALALTSGVNLARAWHSVALDEPVAQQEPYREGVVYRSLEADITAAWRGRPRYLFERHPAPRVGNIWQRDDALASAFAAGDRALARVKRRLPWKRNG